MMVEIDLKKRILGTHRKRRNVEPIPHVDAETIFQAMLSRDEADAWDNFGLDPGARYDFQDTADTLEAKGVDMGFKLFEKTPKGRREFHEYLESQRKAGRRVYRSPMIKDVPNLGVDTLGIDEGDYIEVFGSDRPLPKMAHMEVK